MDNWKHLIYDIEKAHYAGETRHAIIVMNTLGIIYQHRTPQSMGPQWTFWNCENIPDSLPEFIRLVNFTPRIGIGHGLSSEMAEALRTFKTCDGLINSKTPLF